MYFGLPNRRTCALIYFCRRNRACAGLLGTVRLFILATKSLEYTKNRQFFFTVITVSSKPALICNSDKGNDLFLRNVLINTFWVYSSLHNFQPCVLIRACAFIYKSKIFRPVHLFGSVHLLGSPK